MPPSGGGGLGGMFSGLGGLMGMGGPQGGGSHDEGKNIKFLHKDGQLAEELKKAGGKLVRDFQLEIFSTISRIFHCFPNFLCLSFKIYILTIRRL